MLQYSIHTPSSTKVYSSQTGPISPATIERSTNKQGCRLMMQRPPELAKGLWTRWWFLLCAVLCDHPAMLLHL
jgi:hypothetical protein